MLWHLELKRERIKEKVIYFYCRYIILVKFNKFSKIKAYFYILYTHPFLFVLSRYLVPNLRSKNILQCISWCSQLVLVYLI